MKAGGREKGKKGLSYKLALKRLSVNLPVDVYTQIKKLSDKENKTLSLIITELLQKALKLEKQTDKERSENG